MGNESCFTSTSKVRAQHPQAGYAIEDIEADRRYLSTHCAVQRNDFPSREEPNHSFQPVQQAGSLSRAQTFSHQKRYTEEEQRYAQAIQKNPIDQELHFQYGQYLFEKKKLADAERQFKQCLSLNPEHGKAHRRYSQLLGFMGRVRDAQSHYELACVYDLQPDASASRLQKKRNVTPSDQSLSTYITNPYASEKPTIKEPEPKLCIVCANNEITHSNKSCGHLCVCEECANKLKKKCPLCNQTGQFIKIYMA